MIASQAKKLAQDIRASSSKQRLQLAPSGLLAGVLVVVAYLGIGLNLLPLKLPPDPAYNEVGILVVTALGAFAWMRGKLLIQGWSGRRSRP